MLPFDLSCAPAVHQALVNNVLRDMINWFLFVYMDNIFILSESQEEHIQHVCLVLQRLLENKLFMKVACVSCHLCHFAGFCHPTGQLSPDPSKVKAMVEWPTPSSRKQLQRFLGVTNFYR